jgi:hypothetical protein
MMRGDIGSSRFSDRGKAFRFLLAAAALAAVMLPPHAWADSPDAAKDVSSCPVGTVPIQMPTEAGAVCRAKFDLYHWYSKVDAVVHVRVVGKERKGAGKSFYKLKVLRSWKNKVPKSLVLPAEQLLRYSGYPEMLPVYPEVGGEMRLSLYMDESGKFRTTQSGPCSEVQWGDTDPVQWLDQIESCGCKVFDAQGFHDAADLVVSAKVSEIRKEGARTFAEIHASVLWSKFEHDLPEALGLTVLTDDGRRKGCGYPVNQWEHYRLYLRRDREGGYSTDICSGNLGRSQRGAARSNELLEDGQPKPPVVKKEVRSKCACEKLGARGLYDRADTVVLAEIKRVVEKGSARFVDLENVTGLKNGRSLPDLLRVYTGDVDSECRYSVSKEGRHILYLRRDGEGGFSTDDCSGNLGPHDDLGACAYWLQKQEFPLTLPARDDACLKRY